MLQEYNEIIVRCVFSNPNSPEYHTLLKRIHSFGPRPTEQYDLVIKGVRWVAVIYKDTLFRIKSEFPEAIVLDRKNNERFAYIMKHRYPAVNKATRRVHQPLMAGAI